jgi:hypothetical protein
MVMLAVPVFGGVVPVDRSLPKLRQAHIQLDNGNLPGCAVLLREAIRLHLLAMAEFYNIKPEHPKRPAKLLKQLNAAGAICGTSFHWFHEILIECHRVTNHQGGSEGSMAFALRFAYEQLASNQVKFGRV